MSGKTALIFGSTGLTGSFILQNLLENPTYGEVRSFVRKKTSCQHPKLIEYVIDMNFIENSSELVKGNDLFLCLGTTIKKAGSKDAFIKVDFTYNLNAARIAAENRVSGCYLISAVGADKNSFNFYSSVKGKLEAEIAKLPFRNIGIFRPSLLLGERKEFRAGERIAEFLSTFITPALKFFNSRYTPVHASVLADSIVNVAVKDIPGIQYYEYKEINQHQN